jgi:hyperosmotically inducible protein
MNRLSKTVLAASMAAFALTAAGCESTPKQESTGEYVDATVISTKVRAKIAADKQVSIFDIDVKTFKDTVQLSGFVNTGAEKVRAGQLAAAVDGVRRVENNITVKN